RDSFQQYPPMTKRTDADFPVRLGRTFSLISFSRNAVSYRPRPRLRSQTTTSMMASLLRVAAHNDRCPKGLSTGHEATGHFTSRVRGLARSIHQLRKPPPRQSGRLLIGWIPP